MKRRLLPWVLPAMLILGGASCLLGAPSGKPENVFESPHFVFYYSEESEAVLRDIQKALEGDYERITSALGVNPERPFNIFLFPDSKSYRKAIGRPKAGNESVSTVEGINIYALTPEKSIHGYDETMDLLVHEWVHALFNYINGSVEENNDAVPVWLNEGLAVSLAGQMDKAVLRDLLGDAIQRREFLSITEDLNPDRFSGKAYPYSYTLVEFLLQKYGMEVLVSVIKTPEELTTLLPSYPDDLQQEWEEYLIRTYAVDLMVFDLRSQPYGNWQGNSFSNRESTAQGTVYRRYQHTPGGNQRGPIRDFSILDDHVYLLDFGCYIIFYDQREPAEHRSVLKNCDSYAIYDPARAFFVYRHGFLNMYSPEDFLSTETLPSPQVPSLGRVYLDLYGTTLDFFYPDKDYYIAVSRIPWSQGGPSQYHILKNSYRYRESSPFWEHLLPGGFVRPVVSLDGKIILAAEDTITACDLEGNLSLLYRADFFPIHLSVGPDNLIYLVSYPDNTDWDSGSSLTCLDTAGSIQWSLLTNSQSYITQPPLVDSDSFVYVMEQERVHAFKNGEKLWDYPLSGNGETEEPLMPQGTVLPENGLLISDENRIIRLNEEGDPIWIYDDEKDRPFMTRPLVDEQGRVVAATNEEIIILE